MLDLKDYYLHATGGFKGCNNDRNAIIKIVREKEILSKKELGSYSTKLQMDDEICLCDPSIKKEKYFSSFFEYYPLYSPILVLDRKIKVYKPQLAFFPETGQTNLYDEVRCKTKIDIEHVQFITFPIYDVEHLDQLHIDFNTVISNLCVFKENVKLLKKAFSIYPLKDIYTGKDIDESYIEEKQKRLERHWEIWT